MGLPAEDARSPVGRTKTAPDLADGIGIAVVSCSSYWSGWWNAYDRIAGRDDVDVVVHCGDHICDTVDSAEWVRRVDDRFEPDYVDFRSWRDLDEVRRRSALHYAEPGMLALHLAHPLTIVWDNHDVGGDTEDQPELARQAFWEWTPCRPPDPVVADDGNLVRGDVPPRPPSAAVRRRRPVRARPAHAQRRQRRSRRRRSRRLRRRPPRRPVARRLRPGHRAAARRSRSSPTASAGVGPTRPSPTGSTASGSTLCSPRPRRRLGARRERAPRRQPHARVRAVGRPRLRHGPAHRHRRHPRAVVRAAPGAVRRGGARRRRSAAAGTNHATPAPLAPGARRTVRARRRGCGGGRASWRAAIRWPASG